MQKHIDIFPICYLQQQLLFIYFKHFKSEFLESFQIFLSSEFLPGALTPLRLVSHFFFFPCLVREGTHYMFIKGINERKSWWICEWMISSNLNLKIINFFPLALSGSRDIKKCPWLRRNKWNNIFKFLIIFYNLLSSALPVLIRTQPFSMIFFTQSVTSPLTCFYWAGLYYYLFLPLPEGNTIRFSRLLYHPMLSCVLFLKLFHLK